MLKYIRTVSICLFLLNPFILHASSYDSDILNVFSKLMPRFILMSSIKHELDTNIDICIVHESEDIEEASSLESMIHTNYPNGIKNYEILITKVNYESKTHCADSQLIFLFDSDRRNIENFLSFTYTQKLLVVSYSPEVLHDMSDISLYIGRKIQPYINAQNVKEKHIELENILYRISKIYSKRDD